MVGVDAGMDWRVDETVLRTTVFWHSIDDLIGNATIATTPVPRRRRANFGTATGRGVEIEVQRAFRRLRLEAAYLYVDSQVEIPASAFADGSQRWMPQTPRHQGSCQLLYSTGETLLSGGIRSYDAQFEDDLNQLVLPGFATVQLLLQRRLGQGFSALLAVENLLNRTYLAGFTPEPTTGTPRLWRVGLKWESGG
jgi:outer membrane receptor protein involved in Fe transport